MQRLAVEMDCREVGAQRVGAARWGVELTQSGKGGCVNGELCTSENALLDKSSALKL